MDPQAFIMLVTNADHPEGHVTLFHHLQWFEPQLGHLTPFNGNSYAFFGDLVSRQVLPSVEWPAMAFHQAVVAI
jgi:hypothetical protein